ncbi:hypothetical protein [Ferribacterium limneticum]|uniref:hypothetical protein n=1 Tax=Ferribacterium limneticum TaxID=76259 RepID=UPI001CFC3E92|nr:hypothetical protein [Ferribacterium limneticum]UCV28082.1 hypothetical protein KI617_17855 [Ferribacterium limneticum]UCV31999.1 hypothetical protein KI608_17855 [Ferribacterium limneticum]
MTGNRKRANPSDGPSPSYVLTGKTNNIVTRNIESSFLTVFAYRIINNQTEHQTDPAHMPAAVAAGRLIDDLTHLFTSYNGAPKPRKTSIEQLTSKINRAISEMVEGHIRGVHVSFPIGCEMATYGLRNCDADGNTSTLTVEVSRNGRISERYSQGGNHAN